MVRRAAILCALVSLSGLTAVVVRNSAAALALSPTTSNITAPADGKHYFITDASPTANVLVTGTSDGVLGDHVDIRCYIQPGEWETGAYNVPVAADGTFSTHIHTDDVYGTCKLRAVPSAIAVSSPVTAYTGPRLTTEWKVSEKIDSGPNAGKIYDYYIEYVSAHAMNDYASVSGGGLWDTHLQYADGSSSAYLWYGNAVLHINENGLRASLQVDGRNAYPPDAAQDAFVGAQLNPGFQALSFSSSRNTTTGVTTIHETDPIVVCSTNTFPPSAATCPTFKSAGVRLERTIVTNGGGLQAHISDVWRSTDKKAHAISAHYGQEVEGSDRSTGGSVPVQMGLKLPWVSGSYAAYTTDTVYSGPPSVPASVFVHDNNLAANGDTTFARGAISFDVRPTRIERVDNRNFIFRDDGIKVPAGGTRLVRQNFVVGTTDSSVATKAAANRKAINPYRVDALIKKAGAPSFLGNQVYNTTGLHQSSTVFARRSTSATFYIQVQNDGSAIDSFTLKSGGGSTGFAVKYLAGGTGSTDISSAVEHGTYQLKNLMPHATRTIRLVVSVRSGAAIGAVRSWLLQAVSAHDGSRKDAVKANVHVVAG